LCENVIKVGAIIEDVTPTGWRELERLIAAKATISYVKRAPANAKLKIVETKGDLRENEYVESSK